SEQIPLDINRDLIWVKSRVRTKEPVTLSPEVLEQLRYNQTQSIIQNYMTISNNLITNPEFTPNITASIWNAGI
ncbi:1856_t:CDS:1, partial [Racocetra persica]